MGEFIESIKGYLGDNRSLGRDFYKMAKRVYLNIKRTNVGGTI